jgi:hypothetical protein
MQTLELELSDKATAGEMETMVFPEVVEVVPVQQV